MKTISIALIAGFCALARPALAADPVTFTEKDLYSFCSQTNCFDGENPWANLIDLNGTLYGTTVFGGNDVLGTVFALNPATGAETVIYSFCSQAKNYFCLDGSLPQSSLIAVKGKLYGTTSQGGDKGCDGNGCGTVFSVDPSTGTETVLHNFSGGSKDGAYPYVGLIEMHGNLYGTTFDGGKGCVAEKGCGTVFQVNASTGKEKVLYSFCMQLNCADGADPYASLIEMNGMLYGTTFYGGAAGCPNDGCGTVFSLDPKTGAETVLHAFSGGTDGALPQAGLIDVNGLLYGTTQAGGGTGCQRNGCGTVFSIDPGTGVETVVHSFTGGSDGTAPEAALIEWKGELYGTTLQGGGGTGCAPGCGTVFSIDPNSGKENVIYAFKGTDMVFPAASLTAMKGALYGTTQDGGANRSGMVFELATKRQ
jgi:uncharacterized repeat protein (TIGR03803 family)